MARIRTIKPEFWTDGAIIECSTNARLLFVGTWTFADDAGNLDRSAKQLKAQIFPADSFDCEPLIQELIVHGLLVEYSSNGKNYLHIQSFAKHQRVDRPGPARCPIYDESSKVHRTIAERSTSILPRNGREGKGEVKEVNQNTSSEVLNTIPEEPTANTLLGRDPKGNGKPTKAGMWAADLMNRGVKTTSMHPTMLQLIEDGYELPAMIEALAVARQRKPEPELIPIGYLDTIVRNPPKAAVKSWYASESATLAKGKELGLEARPGEEMDQYRDRLRTAGA